MKKSKTNIRRQGLLIASLLAAVTSVIAAVPNWYGLLLTQEGYQYLWSPAPYDNNTYFAKMRPGYRGEWLTTNLYDTIDHEPVLMYPFHVVLGHGARWYGQWLHWRTGEAPRTPQVLALIYDRARVGLTFALFMTLYWLAGRLTCRTDKRLWMTLYAMIGGGIGTYAISESHCLLSCVMFPHFTFSLIFCALTAGAFLSVVLRPDRWLRYTLLCALSGFVLGWVHPFDVLPLGLAGLSFLLVRWITTGSFRSLWKLLTAGLAFGIAGGGPIAYLLWVKQSHDMFQVINAQNYLKWDYFGQWAVALDIFLILALVAIGALARRNWRNPRIQFVGLWILSILIMVNIPVMFQRRMIEGLPIALGMAVGLWVDPALLGWIGRWRKGGKKETTGRQSPVSRRPVIRRHQFLVYGCVLLLLLPRTLWSLYQYSFALFDPKAPDHYVHFSELEAMDWLAEHTNWRDTIWASMDRANAIPYLTGNRVLYGHNVETSFSQQKRLFTGNLFSGQMTWKEFQKHVDTFAVDYLYVGPLEKQFHQRGAPPFGYDQLGRPAFTNGFVEIFRLRR